MIRSDITHTETSLPHPTIKDRLSIHKTILRLTAIYKGIAAVVVVIGALVWLTLINRILYFGGTLDYSGLEALGLDDALIKKYNPFFWWTVIIICTLLITYLLFHFVQYTRHRASQKIVSESDLHDLLPTISPAATQVMAWAWENRRHPITVGVLQQTTAQLAANRYALICLAKGQEQQIQTQLQPPKVLVEPQDLDPLETEKPLHYL